MRFKINYNIFFATILIFCLFFGCKVVLASSTDFISQTHETSFQEWGVSKNSTTPHIENLAQSFQFLDSSFEIKSIDVKLARLNSGFNDNVFITIRSDNNNSPSDLILATSSMVDGSGIAPFRASSTIFGYFSKVVRFNFNNSYNLTSSTRYWFVMERVGYVDYATSNFYVNAYSATEDFFNQGVQKYLYQEQWHQTPPGNDLWFVINNTVDSPSQFWSKVQNAPSGSLELRQTAGTENKPGDDIIENIVNGQAIKVLSTSDDSYVNSVDIDGYRWYKVMDVTNGRAGWLEAKSLNDGTVYLSYDQANQAVLEREAIAATPYNVEQLQTNSSLTGGNAYVEFPGFNIDITGGNLLLNNVVFRVKKQDIVIINDSCKWQAQVWTLNSSDQEMYPVHFGSIKSAQEINTYVNFTDVKFTFDSVVLFKNTKYHILIYPSDPSCSGSEFPVYAYNNEDVKQDTSAQWTDYYHDTYDRGHGDLYFKINAPDRKPVIIVPGIIGSYLNNVSTNEEIWPNVSKMMFSGDDNYLDDLMLKNDGSHPVDKPNIYASDILRTVWPKDVYRGLIDELEKSGYEEKTDLFVFPYDWRLDLNLIADDGLPCQATTTLKCFIEYVKEKTSSANVDVIAHSMGGLIVKAYVAKNQQGSIGKFIDVATPHFGAPKAFKILNYGDNLGFWVGPQGFGVGLNSEEIKKISQNMPSVYELLPSRKYFQLGDGYNSYYSDLMNLCDTGAFGDLDYEHTMKCIDNIRENKILPPLNDYLHNEIDNVVVDDSYNIIGCSVPTIGKIKLINKTLNFNGKNLVVDYSYDYDPVDGDGTVPFKSAAAFGSSQYYVNGGEHGFISSANGVKQLAVSIVKGEESSFDFSKYAKKLSNNSSFCSIKGKKFVVHSPLAIHIYDREGNHAGPLSDGDLEISIPGVQYEIIENNKLIFLPDGQEYKIVGKATDIGTFDAKLQKFDNGVYVESAYYNNLPLTSISTKIEMNIASGDQIDYSMKMDQNGDGIFERQTEPSSILNEQENQDEEKPISSIVLSGLKGNKNYWISDVGVVLSANDNTGGSGLLKTEYSFDGGQSWQLYQSKLFINQSGTTTIMYYSTDRAGNKELYRQQAIFIDKTIPEITVFVPEENQEIEHSRKLSIDYLIEDDFSGVAADKVNVYFNGREAVNNIIDLFYENIGGGKLKIISQDNAGNQAEAEISFQIIATIDSAIEDVNRAYIERIIAKQEVKTNLLSKLIDIKKFIEKNGQRVEKRQEVEKKVMDKCIKQKGQGWCDIKLGKIFDKVNYKLNNIQKKVVLVKYQLILSQLDLYKRMNWISSQGYYLVKNNIVYLINSN